MKNFKPSTRLTRLLVDHTPFYQFSLAFWLPSHFVDCPRLQDGGSYNACGVILRERFKMDLYSGSGGIRIHASKDWCLSKHDVSVACLTMEVVICWLKTKFECGVLAPKWEI